MILVPLARAQTFSRISFGATGMMIIKLPTLIVIVTGFSLIVIASSLTFSLYDGCDSASVVCVGARNNESRLNSGGCIKDKDCQVMVKVFNATLSSGTTIYQWELAVEWNKLPSSASYRNYVYLAVTQDKMSLAGISGNRMPVYIPYYSYANEVKPKNSHFEPRIETCKSVEITTTDLKSNKKRIENKVDCNSTISTKLTTMESKNFVHFNPMSRINYVDSRLTYYGATGSSDQVLKVNIKNSVNYSADLFEDKLTISLFHWSAKAGEKWSLVNEVRNIEPFHFFKKEVTKKSLLWLWILIGVVGAIIIVALCICCCIKKCLCCN